MRGSAHAEIEQLFGNAYVIAAGLAIVGVMIVVSGMRTRVADGLAHLGLSQSVWIGAIQGLCLPFRGFSRSGSAISTGLLLGVDKQRLEEYGLAIKCGGCTFQGGACRRD